MLSELKQFLLFYSMEIIIMVVFYVFARMWWKNS